jgi:hypothetical protein
MMKKKLAFYFPQKIFYVVLPALFLLFFRPTQLIAESNWQEKTSKHFEVIFKTEQAYLADIILSSAESSLSKLREIFDYTPSEKIVIATFDYNDYGSAVTTTIPQNIIRIEIEPVEQAYENIPFTERIQWLLNHELVHVVVNDQASGFEKAMRTLFGKVEPEQQQPLTVLYSLITNFSRYTPMWHQEGIAVFLETWLNGGFGRVLGNFDEMYFRTLVYDKNHFPSPNELESVSNNTSFLIGTMSYLFGERFCTFLAINYGVDKLIDWYKVESGDFYTSFKSKFLEVFHIRLEDAWKNFIISEKLFQKKNIARIEKAPLTNFIRLDMNSVGWVSQAHYMPKNNSVIFGYDLPGQLAGIKMLKLSDGSSERIGTLPSPSLFRVSSTAYDDDKKLFFYTTKNNELFRDLWVMDIQTHDTKILFQDCRIGDLTISSKNHELWGVIHNDGRTFIAYSPYPYKFIKPLVGFDFGDEISDLSISPSDSLLACVLHRPNGEQSIVVVNCENIKQTGKFQFITITDKGTPEFPAWSKDGNFVFWNAYVNGVSNIYRKNLSSSSNDIEPLSNVIEGLFQPVYLNKDSLFAFEFTAEGFIPVIIPNKPADFLPAIKYYGDEVVSKDPQVLSWIPKQPDTSAILSNLFSNSDYNSLSDLKISTFIPIISGFQDQKVFGFYSHISDPLFFNNITMEFGVSPISKYSSSLQFHFKGKYEYKKQFELTFDHNASDFYDLFNKRKRGMFGTKAGIGYTNYWIYDNPLKFIQKFNLDYYTGVSFLSDNLVKVSQNNFAVAQTSIDLKNLRKSIGSINYEEGNQLKLSGLAFVAQSPKLSAAGQFYGEWDNYSTWLFEHNIFHFKISGGYTVNTNKFEQAKFYLGGFGNRTIEDVDVNQFRDPFRFPGIPIYSLSADEFGKLLIENEFPPMRFANASLGSHFLNYINLSLYSQSLITKYIQYEKIIDIGAQINFVFIHWYNLESTLSAGIAKAWQGKTNSWDWFLSLKLLRDLE